MKRMFLILLLVNYSCSQGDFSNFGNFGSPSSLTDYDLSQKLNSATWKITFYKNKGVDETNLFSSYVFKFNKNQDALKVNSGKVDVNYQTNKYEGTWIVYQGIIGYNSSQDTVEFGYFIHLSFISPDDLLKIEGDWQSISETNTKIEFVKKFNNEIISYLTLEKN